MIAASIAQSGTSTSISSSTEFKGKILFDESHHQFWTACIDSGLVDYANELRKNGYQVDALTNGPITYSKLKEYDIFAFPNGFIGKENFEQGLKPLDEEEIYSIKQFVHEGGGLALFECGWSWVQYSGLPINDAPINQIGNVFGITLNDDIIHDPTNYYTGSDDSCPIFYRPYITEHPITKDVYQISNCEGVPSSLNLLDSGADILITGDNDAYSSKYISGQEPPFLAATVYGMGRVVLFGQTGIVSSTDGNNDGKKNIYEYDNKRLGLNIMDWLLPGLIPDTSPGKDEFNWIPPSGKTLVWSDEFDGTNINRDNWDYDTGPWPYNGEAEYYTDNGIGGPNAYVSNGALVIKAMKQTKDQREYTSARLKTEGKQYWKYGTIVAKMKLPYGKGIWPAFWMMGNDMAWVGWPKCGEIDIMELVGGGDGDKTTYATMHWGESSQTKISEPSGVKKFTSPLSQGWHYYQMDWDPNYVVIKFDGEEYFHKDISNLPYFHKPFFLLLNMAIGGEWPGYPDETTRFPQYMYSDWVRVYQ